MGTTGEPVNRNRTIINLAYEGVPQRAIARALLLSAGDVLALVRRKFCTHGVVESRRWAHSTPTDPKIVSVMICSIRKRLRGRYVIQTVQGNGYFMSDDDRRRTTAQLLGCIGVAVDDAAVKKLTGNLKPPAADRGRQQGSLQRQARGPVHPAIRTKTVSAG
jgi:hypothetical protein